MVTQGYLTIEQINILLQYYYLKKYTKISEADGISVRRVKLIKENALVIIRLAYSKSYMKRRFDGETVLRHMAERCGMEPADLTHIFDTFIVKGLASEKRKYWERIKKKGDVPTAAELLDFIYDKFEVDIEGNIW